MTNVLNKQTEVNPELDHQIVLRMDGSKVVVSCNCLLERDIYGRFRYKTMGTSRNLKESRTLYNNPENHNKPFDFDNDRAKW